MSRPTNPMTVGTATEREQLEAFLETYRSRLDATLDGLSEQEARRRLVPSQTTLLGLLKHLTYVQTVWFTQAVTGATDRELGLPTRSEQSFLLADSDTIESVRADYRAACAASREQMVGRSLDEVVDGRRPGPLTLRWIHLQCLREFAHHCGHADILREQVIAGRDDGVVPDARA